MLLRRTQRKKNFKHFVFRKQNFRKMEATAIQDGGETYLKDKASKTYTPLWNISYDTVSYNKF